MYCEKEQAAAGKLKDMLGTVESGKIGNRLVTWKNTRIQQFSVKELKENEPELYLDYTDIVTHRGFTIQ